MSQEGQGAVEKNTGVKKKQHSQRSGSDECEGRSKGTLSGRGHTLKTHTQLIVQLIWFVQKEASAQSKQSRKHAEHHKMEMSGTIDNMGSDFEVREKADD